MGAPASVWLRRRFARESVGRFSPARSLSRRLVPLVLMAAPPAPAPPLLVECSALSLRASISGAVVAMRVQIW